MKLAIAIVFVVASLPLSYAQSEHGSKAQEMYYRPPNGECDFGTNYTTADYVTGACPFAFNHNKIILSNEPLDNSGLFLLRYDAANWRDDDKDATMLCFPNNTVIYSLTQMADNITKANFEGDGFYYLKENLDTVVNLCDLMGESEPIVPSPSPSSVTNPPSSAHKCTHWQSIAMVVQVAAFFASLQ